MTATMRFLEGFLVVYFGLGGFPRPVFSPGGWVAVAGAAQAEADTDGRDVNPENKDVRNLFERLIGENARLFNAQPGDNFVVDCGCRSMDPVAILDDGLAPATDEKNQV